MTLLMAMHIIRRDKSVPELVTVMCEANKVELLMSFNFVEYFKAVQMALAVKARNQDPLERPLYSHILHRWHIQRGNYRAGLYLCSTVA
jgi:hypothetical protein